MQEKEVTDLIMGAAMGWRGVAGRGVGEDCTTVLSKLKSLALSKSTCLSSTDQNL